MKKICEKNLFILGFCVIITALGALTAYADTPAPVSSYSFEGDYGDASAIEREEYYSDEGLIQSSGASFSYSEGMLGQCIQMNGTEGLKLNVSIDSESYTVSYWLLPDRITDCTPSLMITPGTFLDEKFINITLSVDNISPNVWTHMLEPYDERCSTGMPGLLTTDEWLHVTMVVDENMSDELLNEYGVTIDKYTSGVALYANGYLVAVGKVPKGICTASSSFWFGVNIWDDLYSGYVDELYFFDDALDEDEVWDLYLESGGDADTDAPTGKTNSNSISNGIKPNGSSFDDDYVEAEQGTISGTYNYLNMENAAPVATQGVESTTNAYSEFALLIGIGFLLLGAGLLLQYFKRKKNSYC